MDWTAFQAALLLWVGHVSGLVTDMGATGQWEDQPELVFSGPHFTLKIISMTPRCGWDNVEQVFADPVGDDPPVFESVQLARRSHDYITVSVKFRAFAQTPGGDSRPWAHAFSNLVESQLSLEEAQEIGIAIHEVSPQPTGTFEREGRLMSQTNVDLVLSFANIRELGPVPYADHMTGTFNLGGHEIPFDTRNG